MHLEKGSMVTCKMQYFVYTQEIVTKLGQNAKILR